MKTFHSACPLNCWDQCSFIINFHDGRITSINPNPEQEVTGAFICNKGKKHLSRMTHPDRLTYPLLKTNGQFNRISWTKALETAAERITAAINRYGPLSLLHYYDGGHGGVLKNIESRFFSALGGCTIHQGSLCWSAGLAAQTYDFGDVLSHSLSDLSNSRLIIIWGRNPASTAVHQLPFIDRARGKGARVILIDPIRTATAALADEHIAVRPGTDGALALSMAYQIINEGFIDSTFIQERCSGFSQFREMVQGYSPEKASAITGLPESLIVRLARQYASAKPASILLGYGLQRYSNSGNTIRAIDALGALTGNIGTPGGGVNYANFQVSPYIDHAFLEGTDLMPARRYYAKPKPAAALRSELTDPPVQIAYISRANPLTQSADSSALKQAFHQIPFKIVTELFMTDTARAADLVLPCTFFLEEEELYYNSMSHCYLSYGPKIIDPPGECRHEVAVLQSLAKKLGVKGFPDSSPNELLRKIIQPLTRAHGITLEQLKEGPRLLPGCVDVPWRGRPFATADNKFNFYAACAEENGCSALPVYLDPQELCNQALRAQGYIYWFATPHPAGSIHSAHRLPGAAAAPKAYLHPDTALKEAVRDGDEINISSIRGSLRAEAKLDEKIPPDCVVVYEGWWEASGAAVNRLTPERLTDMGNQAALYDCLCRIELTPKP